KKLSSASRGSHVNQFDITKISHNLSLLRDGDRSTPRSTLPIEVEQCKHLRFLPTNAPLQMASSPPIQSARSSAASFSPPSAGSSSHSRSTRFTPWFSAGTKKLSCSTSCHPAM